METEKLWTRSFIQLKPRSCLRSDAVPFGDDASKPGRQLRSRDRVALKDGRLMAVELSLVVLGERLGGQDHDRDRAGGFFGAKRLHDVEATEIGHHHVEQDQVRL